MKSKMFKLLSVLSVLLLLLSGCGQSEPSADSGQDSELIEGTRSDDSKEIANNEETANISDTEESFGSDGETENDSAEGSVVYFTSDISAEGMMAVYEAIGWEPTGKVAFKISTGEPPASN